MKKKTYFLLLVVVLFFTALPVFAATFKTGRIIEQKEAIIGNDLYAFGGSVDVSGNVTGDVVIAGGNISVIGNVSQDVAGAGGTVTILGDVGDDVRIAGGNVSVAGRVGGDLIAAGGFVKILSGSTVSKDLLAAGGTVIMDGSVAGDLSVSGGDVVINGPVNGNVTLKYTQHVTLGPDARIAGNLTYSADEALTVPEGVFVGGDITRVTLPQKARTNAKELFGFLVFAKFITLLIAGLLAVLVFKRFSNDVGSVVHAGFWKQALIGFIMLIIVPIIAFLLFMSFFGIFIGGLVLFVYALLLMVAALYSGVIAGAFLSKWIKKHPIVDWKWTTVGFIVLFVLCFVPVIGPLAIFVITMAAFGTIGTHAYKKLWLAR